LGKQASILQSTAKETLTGERLLTWGLSRLSKSKYTNQALKTKKGTDDKSLEVCEDWGGEKGVNDDIELGAAEGPKKRGNVDLSTKIIDAKNNRGKKDTSEKKISRPHHGLYVHIPFLYAGGGGGGGKKK